MFYLSARSNEHNDDGNSAVSAAAAGWVSAAEVLRSDQQFQKHDVTVY